MRSLFLVLFLIGCFSAFCQEKTEDYKITDLRLEKVLTDYKIHLFDSNGEMKWGNYVYGKSYAPVFVVDNTMYPYVHKVELPLLKDFTEKTLLYKKYFAATIGTGVAWLLCAPLGIALMVAAPYAYPDDETYKTATSIFGLAFTGIALGCFIAFWFVLGYSIVTYNDLAKVKKVILDKLNVYPGKSPISFKFDIRVTG